MNPNDEVIAEFRANSGVVAKAMDGALAGLELVLLHHHGLRSGREYTTPVAYMTYEDDYLLLGSFGGAPNEPLWVRNLERQIELTVEVGTRTRRMKATVLRKGTQRDRMYQVAREHWPFVIEYEKQTTRLFPVIRLAPFPSGGVV